MQEEKKAFLNDEKRHILIFMKWMIIAIICGLLIGAVGVLFSYSLSYVTKTRLKYPIIVFLLPLSGLLIVALYRMSGVRQSKGTNMVISSVRSTEKVPMKMAPLIFLSTALTHLFGGSAGREGAALQLGGSIAAQIGRIIKLDEKDMHIITMCGMSAAFSALFGTPITAAIFPLEVISVGIMYYAALVPCALASTIAAALAAALGCKGEHFIIPQIEALAFNSAWKVIVLAILCALIARIFCHTLHYVNELFRMYLRNQYLRIFWGGCIIVILALLFGYEYLGAGMDMIEKSIEGEVIWQAFLLKIIFTSITLGCGFKGGEIVPSFFIGATFGALIGSILGIPVGFSAAIGLMSVFCGVTNCPITSLLLSFELFGFVSTAYFLLADTISYMLSGYESLYHEQKIMYSKFSPRFIDKKQ